MYDFHRFLSTIPGLGNYSSRTISFTTSSYPKNSGTQTKLLRNVPSLCFLQTSGLQRTRTRRNTRAGMNFERYERKEQYLQVHTLSQVSRRRRIIANTSLKDKTLPVVSDGTPRRIRSTTSMHYWRIPSSHGTRTLPRAAQFLFVANLPWRRRWHAPPRKTAGRLRAVQVFAIGHDRGPPRLDVSLASHPSENKWSPVSLHEIFLAAPWPAKSKDMSVNFGYSGCWWAKGRELVHRGAL